jgi:hypothetical protein
MKTPIIIKNSKIPKALSFVIDVYAITIWPFVFIRDEGNQVTVNHESIHIKQQEELYVLPFYILYVYEWLKNLANGMNKRDAYFEISFEREAYKNHKDFSYLEKRERMAWKNYRGNNEIV